MRRRPTEQLIELGSSLDHLLPAEIAELEAEARVLVASQPVPDGWAADDALTMLREPLELHGWRAPQEIADELGPVLPWVDPERGARARALVGATDRIASLRSVCVTASKREDCLGRWQRMRETTWLEAEGPRGWVDPAPADLARFLDSVPSYLEAAAVAEARTRALPLVFRHARLRASGHACPSAEELEGAASELGLLDGFGGGIDLRTCDEPCALAVHGPAWLGGAQLFVLGAQGAR